MMNWIRGLAAGMAGAAALLVMTGCEVDSASSVERLIGVDFTGFYKNPDGGNITSRNSGKGITSLDLRQGGDRLEAIDNSGHIWKGSIGDFNGTMATFELTGQTTAGNQGRFSGTLTTSDSSGTTNLTSNTARALGTMTGTYIEDTFYATFRAAATIPGTSSSGGGGGGSGGVTISPDGTTLSANGASQSFTASGGSGTYTWSLSSSGGSLSSTTGSSVTYTRTASGNNTLTVNSSSGGSDSVSITQP